MIKGERFIDYTDHEIDPEEAGQCCLRAGHLAVSFTLLAALSGAALTAASYDEHFLVLRTPAAAVLGLSVFLALVTSSVAFFVECRLQETSAFCRGLYYIVCFCCIDDIDRKDLEERLRARNEGGYDNVGHTVSRSGSPEKNSAHLVFAHTTVMTSNDNEASMV